MLRYVQDAAPRYVFVIEDTASMNLQVGLPGIRKEDLGLKCGVVAWMTMGDWRDWLSYGFSYV